MCIVFISLLWYDVDSMFVGSGMSFMSVFERMPFANGVFLKLLSLMPILFHASFWIVLDILLLLLLLYSVILVFNFCVNESIMSCHFSCTFSQLSMCSMSSISLQRGHLSVFVVLIFLRNDMTGSCLLIIMIMKECVLKCVWSKWFIFLSSLCGWVIVWSMFMSLCFLCRWVLVRCW